jgi:tetratricopeptide (TPR) repeat protein
MSQVKTYILILLLSGVVLFLHPVFLFGENDFGYAVYLYKTGNYPGAIIELNRFIYHNPQDLYSNYLSLLVALSYANTGQYNSALASLSALSNRLEGSPYPAKTHDLLCEAYFHSLNVMFRQKMFYDFRVYKEQMQVSCITFDLKLNRELNNHVIFMSAAGYIYNLEWEKALDELDEFQAINSDSRTIRTKSLLEVELKEAMDHRDKSPVLGGLLSIVPGLGHFYAGRPADGFRSLLFNSTFAALTVYAFYEHQYVLGGVLAAVEGVLYASNIYGAVNAVQQENAFYAIQKRDNMLKNIAVPPLDVITIRKELDL